MKKDLSTLRLCFRIAILPIWVALASGCGLPEYTSLEKPEVISDTGSPNLLGFTTPADPSVNGFTLYYKIYATSETALIEEDLKYFDEYTYINDEDEFPPGDKVPRERGFVRAGILGFSSFPNRFTFSNPGPGVDIFIDFGDTASRIEPVVGPAPIATLARGFIDPQDTVNKLFRGFVDDWYFIEDFSDGDLIRPPGIQPGTSPSDVAQDINGDGTKERIPLLNLTDNQLIISFVVHSVGIDIASGKLTPLDSIPVYLGKTIGYSGFVSTNESARNH